MRQIDTDPASDRDLGDELERFVDVNGQALLTFAYLLTGGRGAAAEDLVQTVVLRLVSRGLAGLDDPLAYARRGLVNEHRDQLRRGRVHRLAVPRIATTESTTPVGTPTEDRLAVLSALDTLTERERAAVVLRYYEDLPDPQIAEVLGCSRTTVRSLIHRATPKLRLALSDPDDVDPGLDPTADDRRRLHE